MCDGLFLIEDTARHNGFEPDSQEVTDHIAECAECTVDDWLDEWWDAPIPYTPTEEIEMNGHA